MKDNTLNDTTSPIDAASGVATLSGFKLNLCATNITATSTKSAPNKNMQLVVMVHRDWFQRCNVTFECGLPNTKQDDVAVNILEPISSVA